MLKTVLRSSFFRGSVLVTFSTFIVSFLNYLFNLIISRGISLASYGEFFSAISYINLLTIPFSAFGTILIRKMGGLDAVYRNEYAHNLEKWLYAKLFRLSPLLLIIGTILFFFLVRSSNLQVMSVVFILFSTVFYLLQTFYLSTLQAYQSFVLFGVLIISATLLKVAGGFGVVTFRPDLLFIYGVIVGVTLFQLMVGHLLINRKPLVTSRKLQFLRLNSYFFRRTTLIPLLTTLGFIGLANLDVIIVKKFMSPDDAGLYGAMILLSKIIFFVTAPIASVGYIYFTGKEHKHRAHLLLIGITALIACIGLGATLFYHFFGKFTVNFFFDQRYAALYGILWLGGIYGTLYSLISLYSQFFIAKNSLVSLFALFTLLLQVVTLTLYHRSLEQVMMVNVVLASLLLAAYIVVYIYHQYGQKRNDTSNTKLRALS